MPTLASASPDKPQRSTQLATQGQIQAPSAHRERVRYRNARFAPVRDAARLPVPNAGGSENRSAFQAAKGERYPPWRSAVFSCVRAGQRLQYAP